MNSSEKVRCQDAQLAWAEVLIIWRETEDACARAENALLKYYLRTRAQRVPILTVLAA